MATEMFNDQYVTMSIPLPIVDSKGNPAPIDQTEGIVWTASDATKVVIEPAEDGLSARVNGAGPSGSVTILARADADVDPGEGEQSFIFWTGELSINARQAVGGNLNISEPQDQ